MDQHEVGHADVIRDLERELAEVLDESEQGVYVYLDDAHKLCNERFARLLGYETAEEWGQVSGPFPVAFVAPESREALISAYMDAMERKVGSVAGITFRKRDGDSVNTTVILVPLTFRGHLLALHFIAER